MGEPPRLLMLGGDEHQAAVDHIGGAGYVCRLVGRKPRDQRRHLARIAGPCKRYVYRRRWLALLPGDLRGDLAGGDEDVPTMVELRPVHH